MLHIVYISFFFCIAEPGEGETKVMNPKLKFVFVFYV